MSSTLNRRYPASSTPTHGSLPLHCDSSFLHQIGDCECFVCLSSTQGVALRKTASTHWASTWSGCANWQSLPKYSNIVIKKKRPRERLKDNRDGVTHKSFLNSHLYIYFCYFYKLSVKASLFNELICTSKWSVSDLPHWFLRRKKVMNPSDQGTRFAMQIYL